ncbi:haloacid dehalogenase [Plasmodium falciparum IGH-CR14]|uniref:Haloacid dehalogenase n=1 Tax=Plasmodium falciparum IGH-CR14 TaxID=580059 RepID=A0A0L1IF44_PLAFA|nr:haloacid dehalogenase [Plasmodium falciparum IGH-CR14]
MHEIVDKNGKKVQKNNLNDEIKIIFTDLDGTLLNSENKVSEQNLESLIRAQEKGIKVVIATGRSIFSVESVIGEHVKKNRISLLPGIYMNGCVTFDEKGSRVIDRIMNNDLKMEIHEFSKQINISKYAIWFCLEKTYCFEINDCIREYMEVEALNPDVIEDNMLEGVKEICKYYNISLNNALAMGDGENDIEMLSGLTHSVGVHNASEKVKNSAAYVGPSNNEHAISHVLKTFCDI